MPNIKTCADFTDDHCALHPQCHGCPAFSKPTNYDRIRNMSVEEMAEYFAKDKKSKFPSCACYICEYDYGMLCLKKTNCTQKYKEKLYKQWLETEVTE